MDILFIIVYMVYIFIINILDLLNYCFINKINGNNIIFELNIRVVVLV